MMQLGRFLGRHLGPLLQTGLLLMKNVLKPLRKSVLIPLESAAAESSTDAESFWIRHGSFRLSKANNINNFKWRNGWYHENI